MVRKFTKIFNKAPYQWQLFDLLAHCENGEKSLVHGVAVPARPLGFYGITERIELAWAVFTGRADALFWDSSEE